MKTLIINGSTNKNGDTAALLSRLKEGLIGEIMEVSHTDGISPCTDCRLCQKNPGCAIRDGMQTVYSFIAECDNVVLASPVWFSSLSGPLLDIASRLQTFYAARRFRGEKAVLKRKKGLILIVGGGDKGSQQHPIQVAMSILGLMNARKDARVIYSMNTDALPAENDLAAHEQCVSAAQWMNGPAI